MVSTRVPRYKFGANHTGRGWKGGVLVTRVLIVALAVLATAAGAQTPLIEPNPGLLIPDVIVQFPVPTQFDKFTGPSFPFDNVQGEMVNYETQLIKPILVTEDGEFVVVANEPENRVVVLTPNLQTIVAEIVVGQGITALAERPGQSADSSEIWVSVRHQSSIVVINRGTWRISHLLRANIGNKGIGAKNAANPGGIAFSADGSRAFVAASATNKLTVFNAVTKKFVKNIALKATHNGRNTELEEPMAVLSDGTNVYVVSHASGNQSIVDTDPALRPFPPPFPFTTFGPGNVFVEDLDDDLTQARSLPDFDVMVVDIASEAVVNHFKAVGTTLFGIDLHAETGRLVVANLEARNGELIGEGSFPQGRVVENRITYIDPSGVPANYIYTVTEGLGASSVNIVMPTDVVVGSGGRVFVAGSASAAIGVFDGSGGFLGAMRSGVGPRGLAFSATLNRLYAYNRADNSVGFYNVAGAIPSSPSRTTLLTDPTFNRVKQGRKVFLSPKQSGAQTTGCFSCHQDLRKDRVGWELSKFFDQAEGFTNENQPQWKDRKGVMVTQDLRSLADAAPYHWRGEQGDLEFFNDAFVGLLKGSKLSDPDFDLMKDYVFSSVYPANPFQQMNRVYSKNGAAGLLGFAPPGGGSCIRCHGMPTGTDASPTEGLFGLPGSPFAVKTAQMRGFWTKDSDLTNIINDTTLPEDLYPSTGFGFFHEGNLDSSFEFIDHFFNLTGRALTQRAAFVDEFDSGLAPFTMYSEWLDTTTVTKTKVNSYMINQANAGNGDLAARGRIMVNSVWEDVGLVWDSSPAGQVFLPDSSSLGNFTWSQIKTLATDGEAELLFLGVPVWSGERIGVDRDRDGVFDGDELALGLNPVLPDSDGDGFWDICVVDPQGPGCGIVGAPSLVPGSVKITVATASTLKLVYETDGLSPTLIEFGTTIAYGFLSGEAVPLPAESNHWKRKHTAFIRPQLAQGLAALDDGQVYNFRIQTRGQNGTIGLSGNFSTVGMGPDPNDPNGTLTDQIGLNTRVESIVVVPVRIGTDVTYTATVTLVDSDGAPVVGATVNGRFTHIVGANPPLQDPQSGTTDANGVVVLASTETQSLGDLTFFDIPMAVSGTMGVQNGTGFFAWPEGPSCVETLAP